MSVISYLALVLAFLAVFLLVEGLALSWRSLFAADRRYLKPRLRIIAGGPAVHSEPDLLKSRSLSEHAGLADFLSSISAFRRLDTLILQAGYEFTVGRFLTYTLVSGILTSTVFALLHAPGPLVTGATLIALIAPTVYINAARSRRLRQIEQQMPSALDLMSRAMRAGHAFPSALKMAGEEMPSPIAREFSMTFEEISFGLDAQSALEKLSLRVPLPDVRQFVMAVSIQRATGGNLSVLLLNIAALMRERAKFRGTLRTLTAEGRLSAWILVFLPFALGGLLHIINPGFMDVLFTDPVGQRMVWSALILMALGIFWMSRIIDIES